MFEVRGLEVWWANGEMERKCWIDAQSNTRYNKLSESS